MARLNRTLVLRVNTN